MDKKYIYNGDFMPTDIGKDSYIFVSGKAYTLPSDNKKVQSLIRQGKLTLVDCKSKVESTPPIATEQEINKTEKGAK